ncbi:MAG: sugar ABC transporter permease [Clostridia bacterium]|nr:sugar ABC transporter permease [Clostridia bacterium]
MRKKGFNMDRASFFIITLPALLLYSFFYIYSVILGFYYSMTDWDGLARSFNFIGLDNFKKLLGNKAFFSSVTITFRYALLMVVFTIVLGVLLAVSLNSVKRFKTFFKSVFFFPAMISSVAIALIWDQVFIRALPALGNMFGVENIASPLGNKQTALYAVLFVNMWQSLAMPTVIFIAGLQSIPDELYESALIDGASMFDQFRFVTLPYLVPTITVNAILTLKSGITSFDYAKALTNGGPARSTMLVGIKIYIDAFGETPKFSIANAESVMLFVVIAVLSIVQISISSRSGVNNT